MIACRSVAKVAPSVWLGPIIGHRQNDSGWPTALGSRQLRNGYRTLVQCLLTSKCRGKPSLVLGQKAANQRQGQRIEYFFYLCFRFRPLAPIESRSYLSCDPAVFLCDLELIAPPQSCSATGLCQWSSEVLDD